MKKHHALILWVIGGAVVLWLLWRNRSTVAPTVFNVPAPNYLDVAYPSIAFTPAVTSENSCGCNPAASAIMVGAADAFNNAQSEIEKQLSDYVDSINNYFQAKTVI